MPRARSTTTCRSTARASSQSARRSAHGGSLTTINAFRVLAAAFAMVALLFGGTHAPRASFGGNAHPAVTSHPTTSQLTALRKNASSDAADARGRSRERTPQGDVDPGGFFTLTEVAPPVAPAFVSRLTIEAAVDVPFADQPLDAPRARAPPRLARL